METDLACSAVAATAYAHSFEEAEDEQTTTSLEGEELNQLREKYFVYSPGSLKRRCEEICNKQYLIEGLFPDRSLGLLVGDSGLGKSPLVYQMGLCVASGKPFLGRAVEKGSVLCLDFENGIGEVHGIITNLSQRLGVDEPPNNLHLWNYNDCSEKFGQVGETAFNIIRAVGPKLVIVDSLTGLYPDIEEKNSLATKYYQELRTVMRECDTNVLALHHIKKPSDPPPTSLEDCGVREWLLQARGARALINGCDVRFGVDVSKKFSGEDVALVVKGFGRLRGEFGPIYLQRVRDEDGDPLAYDVLTGVRLLNNEEQEAAIKRLPQTFRFKEAQQVLGKSAQPTDDFLKKCLGIGLIHKLGGKKGYEKL
jgi:KaiC/GvpD/RAD55 family RecA-like ATPase